MGQYRKLYLYFQVLSLQAIITLHKLSLFHKQTCQVLWARNTFNSNVNLRYEFIRQVVVITCIFLGFRWQLCESFPAFYIYLRCFERLNFNFS